MFFNWELCVDNDRQVFHNHRIIMTKYGDAHNSFVHIIRKMILIYPQKTFK